MYPFESLVLSALGPLPEGTVLLAAVSGGADSTAMLAALASLRESAGFSLRCVHVEHGIRAAEESQGDARAVESLCAALAVPCRVLAVPPGRVAERARRLNTGIEAAARYYRRRAWEREARRVKAAAVLVAHTRDDRRETVLMRVLRGSGPAGLARMPAARGIIRRPLIGLSRADVIAYLKARGIPWRIDASNDDNRYFRNRIRNCLVPLLEELFPGWGKGLDALGETQALTADFIAGEARLRVPWEPPAEAGNSGSFGLRTGAENFFAQPAIIREEALFQGINTLHEGALQEEGALQGAEARSIRRQSLRRFCRAAGDRMPDLDLNFCRIRRDDAFVVITGTLAAFRGRKGATETGFSLLIKEPGIYKLDLCPRIETSTLTVCPLSVGLGGFIAALPLVLRPAYNDDFIVRVDRRLSLKDLRGSLPKSRRAVPVTAALDSQGVAAFIAVSAGGTTVWDRGDPARVPKTGDFFFFSIGGIDAQ